MAMTGVVFVLDCPFSDKDQVKELGAKWDGKQKNWYVPKEKLDSIRDFQQWKPKLYLDCPYDEKDEAKQAGAKWDRDAKKWYITHQQKLEKFTKWHSIASPSAKSKRGNAKGAAQLRISSEMTVGQLQEECRFRQMSGISRKKKEWLLEELGIGSIWQSASSTSTSKNSQKSSATRKKTETKAGGEKSTADSKKQPVAKKAPAKPKAKKVLKEKTATTDFTKLPRVTSSLTVAQLSTELLLRDSSIKGLSNKAKPWFLSQLGEQSIWMSSPDIVNVDLSSAPRIGKSLSKPQLMAELLSRLPHLKGLSNKSKGDLLAMAGIGSVWMTGSSSSSNVEKTSSKRTQPVKKKHSEKKPAVKKRRAADPSEVKHSNQRRSPAKVSKKKRATPDAVESRPAAKKIKQEEDFDPYFDDDTRSYESQEEQYVKQESGWYNDESDDNGDERQQYGTQESGWYNDDSEDGDVGL